MVRIEMQLPLPMTVSKIPTLPRDLGSEVIEPLGKAKRPAPIFIDATRVSRSVVREHARGILVERNVTRLPIPFG